jgi:hypothetical protein
MTSKLELFRFRLGQIVWGGSTRKGSESSGVINSSITSP